MKYETRTSSAAKVVSVSFIAIILSGNFLAIEQIFHAQPLAGGLLSLVFYLGIIGVLLGAIGMAVRALKNQYFGF